MLTIFAPRRALTTQRGHSVWIGLAGLQPLAFAEQAWHREHASAPWHRELGFSARALGQGRKAAGLGSVESKTVGIASNTILPPHVPSDGEADGAQPSTQPAG